LTVTTDAKTLTTAFKTAIKAQVMQRDSVTVDLKSGKITSDQSGAAPTSPPPKKGKVGRSPKPSKGGKKK